MRLYVLFSALYLIGFPSYGQTLMSKEKSELFSAIKSVYYNFYDVNTRLVSCGDPDNKNSKSFRDLYQVWLESYADYIQIASLALSKLDADKEIIEARKKYNPNLKGRHSDYFLRSVRAEAILLAAREYSRDPETFFKQECPKLISSETGTLSSDIYFRVMLHVNFLEHYIAEN